MDIAFLLTAFLLGFAASRVGLPPLVGYLVAGFGLHALGFDSPEGIETLADIGVLLLLFGIGLKLRLNILARPHVWGTAGAFAVLGTVVPAAIFLGIGALGVGIAEDLSIGTALIIGLALSFSSTVFAVKALDRTDDTDSFAGTVGIGILIVQDVIAVVFLVAASGSWPSPYALLVVPALVLLRPVFGWFLDRSDHGEVLLLLGFTLALGVGAAAFDFVDLKPDLGALVIGLVLSGHPRSSELADRLLGFKDLLLVGFFLSIGLGGTPPMWGFAIALVAVVLLPTRSFVLFWLLTRFRLRSRSAFHTSVTLCSYSEFGLIVVVAAVGRELIDPVWVSTIGVAVAVSLIAASAASGARYVLYDRWYTRLSAFERQPLVHEDAIVDCDSSRVLIFGMGRIGAGVYDELVRKRSGLVLGVDRSADAAEENIEAGRSVIRGDALDRDFWERVHFHPDVELVVAAMSTHSANLECVARIRKFQPNARIAAVAQYPDQVEELRRAGVDVARNLYEEAGQGLADDAVHLIWGTESGFGPQSVERELDTEDGQGVGR